MSTTPATAESETLSFKEKTGYALGDTASNLFWMTFVFFGSYFYTDVFGLKPTAMATLFFVTRILDTVFDPIMGMLADRTNTRWGKFRPYILYMFVPFGVCGTLAFITPPFGDSGKLIWAYVTYGVIGLVYSAINLPYSALMGVISSSSVERTKVSSFRFVGAYSAGLVVSLCTMHLVDFFGGGNKQLGFALTVGMYAFLGMAMWIVCFATTKERVKPTADQKSSFIDDLADVLSNIPWLVLFALGIATLSYVSIRNGCFTYYFKYYVGDQTVLGMKLTANGMLGFFLVIGSLSNLFGTSLLAPVAKFVSKKTLYMLMMGLSSVLTIAFYFLRPQDVILMFVMQVLSNLLMGPTAALVYAMYADASDYSEWKTGRRSTGLVFAASSFAQKMGWTVGGAVTGLILAGFGYQAGITQSSETLTGLKLLVSFIPAVGSVLAAILPFFYSLGEKRMKQIEQELAERRVSGKRPVSIVAPEAQAAAVSSIKVINYFLWSTFLGGVAYTLTGAVKGTRIFSGSTMEVSTRVVVTLLAFAFAGAIQYFQTRGLTRFSRSWRVLTLAGSSVGLLFAVGLAIFFLVAGKTSLFGQTIGSALPPVLILLALLRPKVAAAFPKI
jgi:glycoside/pentoside/hexuronide:cation symporter, GPH family